MSPFTQPRAFQPLAQPFSRASMTYLLSLCDYHTVRLRWVKGHADNPYNNRCDELAVAESRKYK